jgi:hypothetical protein
MEGGACSEVSVATKQIHSAGKLVDQEQFLYCPVLKCVHLHLANKFLQKKKKKANAFPDFKSLSPARKRSLDLLVTVTRLRAGGFGFQFPAEEDIFLCYKTSGSAVGLTQPPIQWAPGALSPGLETIVETCFFQLI